MRKWLNFVQCPETPAPLRARPTSRLRRNGISLTQKQPPGHCLRVVMGERPLAEACFHHTVGRGHCPSALDARVGDTQQQSLCELLRISGGPPCGVIARFAWRHRADYGSPSEHLPHVLLHVARGIRRHGAADMKEKYCGNERQRTA